MPRNVPWLAGAAIVLLGWQAYACVSQSVRAAALEDALATEKAEADAARQRVARSDSINGALLVQLAQRRVEVDTQIVVAVQTRERTVAVSDTTWESLYQAIRDSFPMLLPLAAKVDTARVEERASWRETDRLRVREVAIADSTATVWEERFHVERGAKLEIEGELAAERALRIFYEAESKKLAIPNLLGNLPKWVQVGGKIVVCSSVGVGAGMLDAPKTGVAAGVGCALGTVF